MLVSFKKNKAFINILSDLELLISEMVDKLDMDPSSLKTLDVVDSTRKYANWNKIDTIDSSNYIQFHRYDITLDKKAKISVPWKGYNPVKDISIKVFFDGKLLVPTTEYTIRTEADSSSNTAGYIIDFGPYLVTQGLSYLTGQVSIFRTTTTLPTNITAVDIGITRYDKAVATAQQNYALPWGELTDDDIYFEVYVNGVLWTEDITAESGTQTYKVYSTYVLFNKAVAGTLTFIRYHKV